MSVQTRQRLILDQLDLQSELTYESLTQMLGVSTMTVRRDVAELAARGHVIKTLGGVQKATASSPLLETALMSRLAEHEPEKRAIAQVAEELIGDRTTLYLDGGTTCVALARRISQSDWTSRELTIVTNSALVCVELGQNPSIIVVGIGGQYDGQSLSFQGPTSEEWVSRFHVDVAFLSTKGFMPEEGTFESAMGLIRIKQIVARQSEEVILLADHSKFGQRSLCKVLNTNELHTIVTDERTPESALDILRRNNYRVHVAPLLNYERENLRLPESPDSQIINRNEFAV